MGRVVVLPAAEQDLDEQALYYLERAAPKTASAGTTRPRRHSSSSPGNLRSGCRRLGWLSGVSAHGPSPDSSGMRSSTA